MWQCGDAFFNSAGGYIWTDEALDCRTYGFKWTERSRPLAAS